MIKVLDRNFSATRSCPIDDMTVVGKRTPLFGGTKCKGRANVSLLLSAYKPEVITIGYFYS